MKHCPECQATVGDTAKFCIKCGFNIKKFEEEKANEEAIFCPECGTKFSGGVFCPECGTKVEVIVENEESSDVFNDQWLCGIVDETALQIENQNAGRANRGSPFVCGL